ncbi:hypothetical protein [Vibrio celticus]|uniref:hypothetical protein n=1 Tax=Vibrio celticus TaxID=446372 RepID=UPI0021C289B6|nr:hypothetical protein [Vibrio celticus]
MASVIQVEPVDPSKHTFSDIYYMQQHNTQDYGDKLTDWLDQGFGIVELDVIDRGRWEHEEFGPYVSHSSSPGNKNCAAAGNTRPGQEHNGTFTPVRILTQILASNCCQSLVGMTLTNKY